MRRFSACCHRNYLITFIRLSLILGGHLHPRLQSHPILPGNDVLLLLPLLVEENLLHLPHGWSSRCQNEINPIWYDNMMTINLVPLTFGTLWACKASRNWTGVSCIYSCHIFCRELMAFIWLIECPRYVIVASHEQIHIPGTEKRQRLANVGFSIGRSKTLWGEPSTKLHRKRKGLLMRKGKWDLPLSIQGVHSCTQDSIQGHKHRFQLWHCYIIVVRWVPSWSSCAKETW